MRHHDHPGHPENPEHVEHPEHEGPEGHKNHDEYVVRLDRPVRDGGRHRKGHGSRRRDAPRRPGFRAAVTAAGAASFVLTVAAGVYVASPAPAAGPSIAAAPSALPEAEGASPTAAATVREAASPAPVAPSTAPTPDRSAARATAARSSASAPGTKAATASPRPASTTASAPDRQTERTADQARQPGEATGAGAEAGTGAGAGAEAAGGKVSEYVQQVVALANAEREKAGCGPLRAENHLRTAAQGHADDMAARDYYEHDSPEGRDAGDRMTGAGYAWSTWGENIHRGPKTPARAMEDWMDSPGHRENILNCSFKDIGVGVTLTANGPWWVQNFGAKG